MLPLTKKQIYYLLPRLITSLILTSFAITFIIMPGSLHIVLPGIFPEKNTATLSFRIEQVESAVKSIRDLEAHLEYTKKEIVEIAKTRDELQEQYNRIKY